MPGNKAVRVSEYVSDNPVDGLEIVDTDIPVAGSGQVLVRVLLRSVNPADVMKVAGQFKVELPTVPGLEGMGEVVQCGPDCSGKFSSGQRVVGMPFADGSWQQYVLAEEANLWAVPDDMSDEEAAQFYLNPFTAWGALHTLAAPPGSWVLQTAGGSVLGRMFTQMAKYMDLHIINTVRRDSQVQELLELGSDEVLVVRDDWGEGELEARVAEVTAGEGVWGAIDCIGGEFTAQVASCIHPGGTLLVYGNMSGSPKVSLGLMDLLMKECTVKGFVWSRWMERLGDDREAEINKVAKLIIDGTVTPLSGKSFPLEAVKDALLESQRPGRGGKVLLED